VLVVTMGLPASGKTTLAHALASRLGLVHLSSDVTRKQLAGMRTTYRVTEDFETGIYSRGMTRRTYGVLRRKAARYLRHGQSVVLDATYGQSSERAALRQLARHTGARLYVIVCRASDAVLQARLATRTTESPSVSDARPELWPALRSAFVEPSDTLVAFEADTTRAADALTDEILTDIYGTETSIAGARAA